MQVVSPVREPLITGNKTYHDVTNDICGRVEEKPSKSWLLAMAVSLAALLAGGYALWTTLWEGRHI